MKNKKKSLKQILSLIMAIALCLTLVVPAMAATDEVIASYSGGNNPVKNNIGGGIGQSFTATKSGTIKSVSAVLGNPNGFDIEVGCTLYSGVPSTANPDNYMAQSDLQWVLGDEPDSALNNRTFTFSSGTLTVTKDQTYTVVFTNNYASNSNNLIYPPSYECSHSDKYDGGSIIKVTAEGYYAPYYASYQPGNGDLNFTVIATTEAKADPTVTEWPLASDITYGQTLADSTLSGGTASVPGTFVFSDTSIAPSIGTSSQSVTFNPNDSTNYNDVTGFVNVTVGKADPSYTTPTGLTATYGQTLADVTLPTGFTWDDATSTSVVIPVDNDFTVTFTPSDTVNYNTISGINVSVTVGKADPSYTTPTGLTATYGQTLADVTLPTGFTWDDATTTSVGNTGNNDFTVTFTPSDTVNYNTISGINVSVAVSKIDPSYTTPTGLTATYGQTLADVTLPTGFTWDDATSTSVGDTGDNDFTVTFTPSDTVNYNTISGINVSVTVGKADPSYTTPTGLTATYGQTLADVTLPTGFTWDDATTTSVGNTGNNDFTVTFTPSDTVNYNTISGINVSVAVSKIDPSYTTPTGLTATYGQTLADVTLPTGFTWDDATSTSVGDTGDNAFTVTFTPSDTVNYNTISGINVSVTVGKADPSYTTPTGLTATYGQTLADVTLPTGFTWDDATTTSVGNTGNNDFTVTFTPSDTVNYNTISGINVSVTVGKADPSYTTPTGLTATYGQTLADVTLPTGFIWDDATSTSVGDTGDNAFTVTFTPSDTVNYNTISGINVSVTVGKADPSYTTPTGLTATYGQTLADVTLPTGFTWDDATSTSVGDTGDNDFTVTFTPSDTVNYNIISGINVSVAVSKIDPSYTTPMGLTATYGQTLADVTLPTGFTWDDATTTSVGNTGNNDFTVTFTPSDTVNYNTISGINVSVTVGKADPSYTTPTGLTATYGQTLADVTLPTGFTWDDATTTSVGNAGNNAFTVTFTPSDTVNYNTISGINVSVTVGKADPSYTTPTGLTATYGQTLADVTLPTGFTWDDATTTSVGNTGNNDFTVTFTPSDTVNYNTISGINVSVAVSKIDPSYTTPTGLTATYGQTLADVTLPTGFTWDDATSTSVGDTGNNDFTVTFTPSDTVNYNTISGINVSVTVGKADPSYTTPTGLTATYGQTLADVTLPTGFTWDDATTTSVGDTGDNAFTVTFTPSDTVNYNTISGINVSVAVSKIDPSYTTPTGLTATYGQTLADVTLPTGFTWDDATSTSVGDTGNNDFTVTFTPSDTVNYNTISGINVSVTVGKADPSYTTPTGLTATYGQTLADVTLPTGFTWDDATTTSVGDTGDNAFTVTFTPSDTVNYNTISGINVSVTVGKAALNVTAVNKTMIYSDTVPTPTDSTTGLVSTDTLASLGITLSTTATSSSNAGTYPITVNGPSVLENYSPIYTDGVLTINPKSISTYTINTIPTQSYYSAPLTPTVTIPGLTVGTDFTVKYTNNNAVGTATATATGIGNYTGTTSTPFTITYGYTPPYTYPSGGGDGQATIASNIELIITFDGNRVIITANLPGAAFDYESLMQEIIESAQSFVDTGYIPIVNLNVPDASANPFEFKLDGAQLSELADSTNALLLINSPVGSVRFDADAVDSLASQAGTKDVTVKIAKVSSSELSSNYPDYVGQTVYDITVSAGGSNITTFGGGEITVSVPYTPTQDELDNGIVIYYMSATGPVMVTDCSYDTETGMVSFVTNHLSKFAIGYISAAGSATDWYAEYLDYLSARGILDPQTFSPNSNITRAEFVTILAAIDGADLSGYTSASFNDVSSSDAYFGAVEWAADNSIILGYDGNFKPNDSITRQDICTILMRYADLVDFILPQKVEATSFTDQADIASYADDAVSGMQQAGILDGFENGSFLPTNNTTQAQAAKIFTVLMQLMIEY